MLLRSQRSQAAYRYPRRFSRRRTRPSPRAPSPRRDCPRRSSPAPCPPPSPPSWDAKNLPPPSREPRACPARRRGRPFPSPATPTRATFRRAGAGHPAGVPDQVAAGYSASASALLTRHDPSMSAATAAARAGYTGGVILGRSVAPGGVGVPATGQYATGQYAAGSPFVDGGGGGWVVDPNSVANVAGNVVGHGSHGGEGKGEGNGGWRGQTRRGSRGKEAVQLSNPRRAVASADRRRAR